jgi:hypothetical protein
MTFLRKRALGISSWVTRWSSPGCREWAEGLEREGAFIESDWRALAWAIGSTRVLLDRRPASAAEGPRSWPKFIHLCGRFWYGWMTFIFAMEAIYAKNWQVRSALVALGWVYLGACSEVRWWRDGDEPSGLEAGMAYRRTLLVGELARARSMRRWITPVIAMATYWGVWMWLNNWSRRQLAAALSVSIFSILIKLADTPEKIEARLARVDAVHAEYEARKLRDLPVRAVHTEVPASPTFSRLFQRRRQSRRRALR